MSKATVAVIGLNGALGEKVLEALKSDLFRDKYEFPIRALTRDPSKYTDSAEVKYYKSDYSDAASLEAALKGVHAVIDLGPAFVNNQPLVDAAEKGGVQIYFPSQYGFDYEDAGIYQATFFLKAQNSANGRKSKITKTVDVSTGSFADWVAGKPGLFNIDPEKNTVGLLGEGNLLNATTNLTDIGRSLASLAHRAPADVPEKVRIYGDQITLIQNYELYEKYHNVKLTVNKVPVDEVLKRADAANEKFQNRDPNAGLPEFVAVLQGLTAHPSNFNNFAKVNDRELVNPGLWKWISFEDTVKQVVAAE